MRSHVTIKPLAPYKVERCTNVAVTFICNCFQNCTVYEKSKYDVNKQPNCKLVYKITNETLTAFIHQKTIKPQITLKSYVLY